MPAEKLQDLIRALKQQGVESGEAAARQLVEDATRKGAEVRAQAQAEAEAIVAQAKAEADLHLKRLHSSMEMAAAQFVSSLKRALERDLLTLPLQKQLAHDLAEPEFLKRLMATFVEAYAATPGREQLKLVLPAAAQDELAAYATTLLTKQLGAGSATLETGGFKFGFQVDKASGNVRLDFSDEAFLALFLGFLAPRFHEYFKPVKLPAAAAGEAKAK